MASTICEISGALGHSRQHGHSDESLGASTAGSFTVTALETQIPNKPNWALQFGFGINDDSGSSAPAASSSRASTVGTVCWWCRILEFDTPPFRYRRNCIGLLSL